MATQTKLLTYDDYRRLPDDGNQYQIIGGELIMSPSPKMIHQIISRNLFRIVDQHVSKENLGEVLYAPADVVLSMRDVVQPDIMFISTGRGDIIAENNVVEAPDLVVEILSESTEAIDRSRKKTLYEKYGTQEYWIIDPVDETIEQFILQEQTLKSNRMFDSSQSLSSSVIEGFSMHVGEIFPE